MAIYKNDYTREEDQMMWELHEVRNEVQEENKGKSVEEINENAKKILDQWKSQHNKNHRKAE